MQNALCHLVEKKSGSDLLNSGMKVPESSCQLADLEGVLQKEKAEFEVQFQFLMLWLSFAY